MINWFNIPDEGLSNGGLFEVKELEVTENGTYETKGEMYNKVTVNVEGGGGESDFSTAEVTVVVDNPETFTGEVGMWLASSFNTTDEVLYITGDEGIFVENNKAKVLMCGNAILNGLSATDDNYDYTGSIISATGNISKNGSGALARWVVIGDGTITVHFSAIMPQP